MKLSEMKARIRLLKFMGFRKTFAVVYYKEIKVEGITAYCHIYSYDLLNENIKDFSHYVNDRLESVQRNVEEEISKHAFLHGGGFDHDE